MADAPALGAGGSNPVEVQVLSPAPKQNLTAFSKPLSSVLVSLFYQARTYFQNR